ncbi:MAG: hypothetical protein RL514_2946 [Verrucomicrobiota bacterium]|jgi:hypothetical protein
MSTTAKDSAPEDWPPELRLLVTQLRLALGTAGQDDRAQLTAPVDWDVWLRWVQRHRVGGFLHHRLPVEARAVLPPAVATQLRAIGLANVQQGLARAAELTRITGLLDWQGIKALAFKGPLLSVQLHGEAGVRHAGDLDLLLAAEDVPRADAALREAGYRRAYPGFELTPFQWRKFLDLHHEVSLLHAQRGITVELQWRLEGLQDASFDALWQDRVPVELAGRSLMTLPAEMGALYLFAHGAKHGWLALCWLLDVALLLQDARVAKAGWWPTAQRLQLTQPLLQGVALAASLLNVPLPVELAGERARLQSVEGLLGEAGRRMAKARANEPSVGATLRDTVYQFRLQESWRGRLALVQPRLLSPENWKLFPLPDALFWLYYPAAPFLWAWRRCCAGGQPDVTPPRAGSLPPANP